MRRESSRAATAATAPFHTHSLMYVSGRAKATKIDEVLAALILGLAVRHHAMAERLLVIGKIDRLLRRKIDLGLVGGLGHGR